MQLLNYSFANETRKEYIKREPDSRFAEHPLNAFHLLHRVVFDWQQVFDTIWCEDCVTDDAAASNDWNRKYLLICSTVLKNTSNASHILLRTAHKNWSTCA